MGAGKAALFGCIYPSLTGADGHFSPAAFERRPYFDQAYLLLISRRLRGKNPAPDRWSPYQWNRFRKSFHWLVGPGFQDQLCGTLETELTQRIEQWNYRLRFLRAYGICLADLPVPVLKRAQPVIEHALLAIVIDRSGRREIQAFCLSESSPPGWERLVTDFDSVFRDPFPYLVCPDRECAENWHVPLPSGTTITYAGAEHFPHDLPIHPEQPIVDRCRWALSSIGLRAFPDHDTAWRIIGGICIDQDNEWSRTGFSQMF